ncbi:unnamed protein product [Lampetra fluviatilis]
MSGGRSWLVLLLPRSHAQPGDDDDDEMQHHSEVETLLAEFEALHLKTVAAAQEAPQRGPQRWQSVRGTRGLGEDGRRDEEEVGGGVEDEENEEEEEKDDDDDVSFGGREETGGGTTRSERTETRGATRRSAPPQIRAPPPQILVEETERRRGARRGDVERRGARSGLRRRLPAPGLPSIPGRWEGGGGGAPPARWTKVGGSWRRSGQERPLPRPGAYDDS